MGKSYAPEFRHRVIQRVRAGRPVRTVSAELGVSEATVFRWVAQDHVDRGESAGLSSIDKVELARARGRIRELETELAVVKKASEFFTTMEKIRPKGSSRGSNTWPDRDTAPSCVVESSERRLEGTFTGCAGCLLRASCGGIGWRAWSLRSTQRLVAPMGDAGFEPSW